MNKHISLNPFSAAILTRRLPYALASILVPGLAIAGPTGGAVVAGQASIGAAGATTTINQSSHSAVINWQQFNVGSNEYVVFNQPNASATILNRIIGGSPSTILGSISANGRVFLVNPQGIVFGQGSRVDVGGLVASTMNIADQDFMSGRYIFSNGSNAQIVNDGNITAANNGFVVLAGDYVKNTGVIQAKLGDVVLASGSAMTLDLNGDGLINFSVDQAALSNRAGVANLGTLAAQGGTVVMTAKVANALTNTAVNNSGQIRANGIEENGGDIYLTATGGDAINSGSIDASAQNGFNAGDVRINSDHDITLAAGSNIVATGAAGGDVRVVAENHLAVEHGAHADVSRQSSTGKGGFAEYSGHESATIRDIVQVGDYGKFLLDPADVTIGDDSGDTITPESVASQLNQKTTNSVFEIDASGTDSGNITLKTDIYAHTTSPGYGGDLKMTAGPSGSITFANSDISITTDGSITLAAGKATGGSVNIGSLKSTSGAITITANGDITSQNLGAATGLTVTSDTGNIKFNDIGVANSLNDSYVVMDNIDANITATTGSITGNSVYLENRTNQNAAGMAATLEMTAGTSISINGANGSGSSIGVYGGGGFGSGGGITILASADLEAGSTSAITLAKNVTIQGNDYDYPDSEESQRTGGATFKASGGQFTVHDYLDISGEGVATIDITGHNGITIDGSTTAKATPASLTINAVEGVVNQETLSYGYALVSLIADDNKTSGLPTASKVTTGNIGAAGPNAIVTIEGGSVEIGDASNTVDSQALGADATQKGLTTVGNYSSDAGTALVNIITGGTNTTSPGILLHGGITSDGPAAQINLLAANDIKVIGTVYAKGEGYTQSGDSSLDLFSSGVVPQTSFGLLTSDAPFALQDGTLNWGSSKVIIAGSGNASAGAVDIGGRLHVAGVGEAGATIDASSLTVGSGNAEAGGDISIGADQGTMSGTFTSQETISGTRYNVTRDISDGGEGSAIFGKANLDITLSGNTASRIYGGLNVTGNSGSATINGGGSFTIGDDIVVGATSIDTQAPIYHEQVSYTPVVTSTDTSPGGVTAPVSDAVIHTELAPANYSDTVTGDVNMFSVGLRTPLTGAFDAGSNSITVRGTGVAGIAIKATSITAKGLLQVLQNAGNISYTPFDSSAQNIAFNDAVFALIPTGTAAASTGQISVGDLEEGIYSINGNLHVGGNIDAGANQVALQSPLSIDNQIPGSLTGFQHPLEGGTFPLTPGTAVNLGALTVKTTDKIFFKFGDDSSLSALNLNAGIQLQIDGDFAQSDSTNDLQLGSNAVLKGGTGGVQLSNLNLSASSLVIDTSGLLSLGGTTTSTGATSLNGTLGVTDGGNAFTLTANSLGVTSANGYIDFSNSMLTVGNGSAKDVNGAFLGQDSLMRSRLGAFAPALASPNASFVATGTSTDPQSPNGNVTLNNLTLNGDYLYVKGKSAGFGTLTHNSANTLFYNFVPRTNSTGADASGIAAFVNHFYGVDQGVAGRASTTTTSAPKLTVAFGSSSASGPIAAGSSQAPIDVSGTNANLLFVTTGPITGSNTVLTGGHVVLLQGTALTVDGVLQNPPPTQTTVDPQAAQQAQDASKAASDAASGGPDGKDKKSGTDGSDSAGDAANAQQDQIETHSNDGITATSCI